MKRIKLIAAYDGTAYHGWQFQPNAPTIEGELNRSLKELLHEEIQVIAGSRTDSGVHALCNVAVFDTNSRIPSEKFPPIVALAPTIACHTSHPASGLQKKFYFLL